MCFAYKSVYCGSVMIQKSCLLSFCVYRSPTASQNLFQFHNTVFLLCLITGSVSHIWSIYHSQKQTKLQLFG